MSTKYIKNAKMNNPEKITDSYRDYREAFSQ